MQGAPVDKVGQFAPQLFGALHAVRGPAVVALIFAVAMVWPAQTQEIYRSLAENTNSHAAQLILGTLAVVALSFLLWACADSLAHTSHNSSEVGRITSERMRFWLPAAVGVLPFVSMAIGIGSAALAVPRGQLSNTVWFLSVGAATALVLALLCFAVIFWWSGRRDQQSRLTLLGVRWAWLCLVAFLTFVVLGRLAPVDAPIAVGPIFIVACFFFFACYGASWATSIYQRRGYPVLLAAFFVIVICSFWNENRKIGTSATAPTVEEDLASNFVRWYANRKDHKFFSGNPNAAGGSARPYPVYLIAAEGGGAYAAYHSAMFLARAQDGCPAFAQHIFAMSAVSGGSLGAALFAGLVERDGKSAKYVPCAEFSALAGPFQAATETFFSREMLSPLIWSSTFSNVTQSFLPVAVPGFDRSLPLQLTFDRAWFLATGAGENYFQKSLSKSWRAEGNSPALLLNTTLAEAGTREVIAPFRLSLTDAPQSRFFVGSALDVPVSVAVSLSARFPWVTSSGHISNGSNDIHLLDGGYVDNTGLATVQNVISDLIAKLRSREGLKLEGKDVKFEVVDEAEKRFRLRVDGIECCPEFQLKVISLRTSFPEQKAGSFATHWLEEVFSPLQTLMRARTAQQIIIGPIVRRSICPKCSSEYSLRGDTFRTRVISAQAFPLSLGWMISGAAKTFIRLQLGDNRACKHGLRVPRVAKPLQDCFHNFLRYELGS